MAESTSVNLKDALEQCDITSLTSLHDIVKQAIDRVYQKENEAAVASISKEVSKPASIGNRK